MSIWKVEGDGYRSINCAVFSPTGDLIASGHHDGTIRLWDLDGAPIGSPFIGHSKFTESSVESVAFNQSGDHIVSSSRGGDIRIYDLLGNLVHKSPGHNGAAWVAAFSPNDKLVASSGHDGAVRIWNVHDTRLNKMSEDRYDIRTQGVAIGGCDMYGSPLAFSPQGNLVVCSGQESSVRAWTLDGELIFDAVGHTGRIRALAFSSNGDLIASGGEDSTMRLWDLSGKPVSKPFFGHTGTVESISFSNEGDYIATGGDNTIRLWNLSGRSIGPPVVVLASIKTISIHPHEDLLVSSGDNTMCLWSLSDYLVNR